MSKTTQRSSRREKTPPASGCEPSMKLSIRDVIASAEELVRYHQLLAPMFQRREQRQRSFFYLCGQLANLERKTIEPMVLALHEVDHAAVRAQQHFIGQGNWVAQALILKCQLLIADWLGEPEGVAIVDGSGFPKQGTNSVGVARQYCGHVGKVTNSQEGVFIVYASSKGYAFLDERLYVHESWFGEAYQERWRKCGIPKEVRFQTEPELGLEMLQGLVQRGQVPFRWVTADEHFGQNPGFLDGIAALGKWYLVEVPKNTRGWLRTPPIEPPGLGPLGRVRTHARVASTAPLPDTVETLATRLSASAWQRGLIKEGSKGPMLADFAFLRVTTVRDELPGPRVWAVFRRNLAHPPEMKFYLSNAPAGCSTEKLIHLCGMRWPVETALEEGKGEVGMDHYETRTWFGWHHHMAQTFAAHLFLMRLRLIFKKKSSAHDGTGAGLDRSGHRGRLRMFARHYCGRELSSASELCRLPFTSQTHTSAVRA